MLTNKANTSISYYLVPYCLSTDSKTRDLEWPFSVKFCFAPVRTFTNDTSYILTYLLSHDINVYHMTTWRCLYDIVAACESGLNTCSKPRLSSVECLRGSIGSVASSHAGDLGSNPGTRTIFLLFLFFSLLIRSTLYSAYSVILHHLHFDSHFSSFLLRSFTGLSS